MGCGGGGETTLTSGEACFVSFVFNFKNAAGAGIECRMAFSVCSVLGIGDK